MNYKESTHTLLLEQYQKFGSERTIAIARAMLQSNTHKKEKAFLSHVHGEICETVLEMLILDFIKENNLSSKGWFYETGLILRDVNKPGSGYFTELDVTLFTPQKIFAFECKSYGGDKRITDKCTIRKKKGGTFDVYDQHMKHFKVLADQMQPFRIASIKTRGVAPYQLILFDFALGNTEDVRDTSSKLLMPCLDEKNVTNILKESFGDPVQWDIVRVRKAINIITRNKEKNTESHLNYVKGLHKKGE